jgi:hypothetical protein
VAERKLYICDQPYFLCVNTKGIINSPVQKTLIILQNPMERYIFKDFQADEE